MSWEKYFNKEILRRGKAYADKYRVTNLHDEGDSCTAVVRGSDRYFVSIEKVDYDSYRMTCSCPYAREGRYCKHEAAVMYKWIGAGNSLKQREDKKINLFSPGPFQDSYFNLYKAMTGYVVKESDQKAAERLLENDRFVVEKITTAILDDPAKGKMNILYGTGAMAPDASSFESGETTLYISKNNIEYGNCTICGNYLSRSLYGYNTFSNKLCVHQTALMMKMGEYVRKYNPGDETNAEGFSFLRSFSNLRAAQSIEETADAQKEVIHLQPRLIQGFNGLELSFKIGITKMYIVKNLSELCEKYEKKGVLQLGKKNDLKFANETFTKESLPYYDWIHLRVQETGTLNRRFQQKLDVYGMDLSLKGNIDLQGVALDSFYDLAQGTTVEYGDRRDPRKEYKGTLKITENMMKVTLVIEPYKIDGRFEGLRLSGDFPMVYKGAQYSYFIRNNSLSRIDPEDARTIAPFQVLSSEEDAEIIIGKNSLAEFYYRVLPILRENRCFEIEEIDPEEIERQMPPEAKFTFYLDIEDGRLECRGITRYDDHELIVRPLSDSDFPAAKYRDLNQENLALETVMNQFPNYNEKGFFWAPDTGDAVYELLDHGIGTLMALGEVQGSDAFNRLKIRKTPMVRVGVTIESDLLNLEVVTDGMSSKELLDVLASYQRKKKYHRLKNGEFIALEQNESLDMLTDMMSSMNVSVQEFVKGHLHLPLYRALYVNKMLEEHDSIASERDRYFRQLIRNFSAVKDSDYDIPAAMSSVMRNYQKYGYKWLHTLSDAGFGGILADDMGLGKTLQMIALLQAKKEEGDLVQPALVVCPASVVYNWIEEIHRFAPDMRAIAIAGTQGQRRKIIEDLEEIDIAVTSYDLLKRDVALYENQQFSYEVLDEGQFIKNPKAAVSKAVKIIRSTHRFALTGTPIENRLSELWSIFDFLMPGFLYSYDNFRSWYETPITRQKDEYATEQLRKMVSPFILRRLKEDVLKDLPEKMEEVRYARFKEEQQVLYDAQVTHMKEMINALSDDESGESRIKILAELTKIRQICCDPSLLVQGYEGESAKREACIELVESAIEGGHKLLVFSQFTSMLELLEKDLSEHGIPYYKITGATSKEDRMKYVRQFNEDEVPVFLISLRAGGTGLNLVGADVVIHYDPWWNLAVQNQATDRAHRIGQTRKVNVYKLIAKGSIEEKILELQESKKDLADAILTGETTSLSSLSKEELLELLS